MKLPITSITITNCALLFLICTSIQSIDAGTIQLCAKSAENNQLAIPNANVRCYDNDSWSNDDLMATGVTGSDGCVTMSYKTYDYKWWSCDGWDYCRNNPDIFCEVNGECLKPKKTPTKNNYSQYSTAYFTTYIEADADFCHSSAVNGCGPGSFPDFLRDAADYVSGFADSCNSHDVCYDNCSKTRRQCENEFRNDMYNQCDGGFSCEFLADIFATFVTNGGEDICVESREKVGCSQPQINTCIF
jgi:hypothetical protein